MHRRVAYCKCRTQCLEIQVGERLSSQAPALRVTRGDQRQPRSQPAEQRLEIRWWDLPWANQGSVEVTAWEIWHPGIELFFQVNNSIRNWDNCVQLVHGEKNRSTWPWNFLPILRLINSSISDSYRASEGNILGEQEMERIFLEPLKSDNTAACCPDKTHRPAKHNTVITESSSSPSPRKKRR